MISKKKVSIVGFGRFGKVLYRLLKDDFEITLYQRSKIDPKLIDKDTKVARDISEIFESNVVFYAIPINAFEKVIASHRKNFQNHLLIDVLSVKEYPAKIFEKYLRGTNAQAILTHPMFGPDSAKDTFEGLPIIMDSFKSTKESYDFWKNYFKNKKLRVVELSAKEHDNLAANSQGLTHFIGRLLDDFMFKSTSIDSLGAKKLQEVREQTCNDTWELFSNLQHFNPYTKRMRIKLGESFDRLYNKLLPKRINPPFITFGIQGGRGSFNEEALHFYIEKEGIKKFKIKYLYTSMNVMKALHRGEIDRGQFATHNSVGGTVQETLEAIAKYKFKIVDQFAIKISHALMVNPIADFAIIDTVMTHPQVLSQCRTTLSRKYPDLKQISGEGEMIDSALVAQYLGEGKLPKNIAVMGSAILAKLYNLKVVENNLQDAKENFTSFMQVERI